jgi:hypothetical protein
MTTFLFTAADRSGKSVTERVEAENLSQARYKLEIRGYSEITFYESELSKDVESLFDKKDLKNRDKFPKKQVGLNYDTRLRRHFFNVLKYTSFCWMILLFLIYINRDLSSVLWFGGSVLVVNYLTFQSVIFKCLHVAHCWGRNKQVRFWGSVAKWFNRIALIKIPNSMIDLYLACADAREDNLPNALRRMAKYQNDPKVSKRLYTLHLVRIYSNARDFEKVIGLYEETLRDGNVFTEEMLDYALCLARRQKRTTLAKSVLEKVFDSELTALARLFVPYCQGVIEVEDGNFSQAEFYLKQASKQLEPFQKNTFMVGLKSEVKAFLAITQGRRGEKEEAEKLFEEAKPYLVAVKDTELIQRCEEALS